MWIYDTSSSLVILGWVFTGLLLMLLITAIATGRGRIPLNHFFGIRLPDLLRSNSAWRAGHRAAVVPAGIAFGVSLLASVVALFVPITYWVSIIAFAAGVAWVFLRASAAAKASTVA
jgi:hypothetical protein